MLYEFRPFVYGAEYYRPGCIVNRNQGLENMEVLATGVVQRRRIEAESEVSMEQATVIKVTKYLTLHRRVRSMLLPHCKRLLHARIGKEFHADLALNGPSHYTLQVGSPGYLFRRDANL